MRILIATLVVLAMAVCATLGCESDPFSNFDDILEVDNDLDETELDVDDDVLPFNSETIFDDSETASEVEGAGMLNGALIKVTTDMFNLANHLSFTIAGFINKLKDPAGNTLTAYVTAAGIMCITMNDLQENSITILLNSVGQIVGVLSNQDEVSRDLRKTLKEVLDGLRGLGVVIPRVLTSAAKGVPGSLTEAFNMITLKHTL
ncbi:uncharacterized protein LOC129803826 [Phlebotomus papatasi]|uniref:uncharacterized protein LOC129803826 n=1 Tax=Phlebotomus papatasi TaxID=29031 RepID=UPI002483D45D|nr:uncharacterized protein LOC129803826 [Phlebotomus papatasi]